MSAFTAAILAMSGLVMYAPLDETSGTTAADASGNGKSGSYVGSVTLGAASVLPAEPAARAVALNSSTGHIPFIGLDGYVHGRTGYSFGLWLRTSDTDGGHVMGWNWNYGHLLRMGFNGGVAGVFRTSSGEVNVTTTPTAVNTGANRFVVATVDKPAGVAGVARIYINGTLESSAAIAAGDTIVSHTGDRLCIGSYQSSAGHNAAGNSGQMWTGTAARAFLFDRAITGTEVGNLHNAGAVAQSLLLRRRRRSA